MKTNEFEKSKNRSSSVDVSMLYRQYLLSSSLKEGCSFTNKVTGTHVPALQKGWDMWRHIWNTINSIFAFLLLSN